MEYDEFEKQLKTIPGDDGFWKNSTKDAYMDVADKMIEKGFTRQETLDLLSLLYQATADEFGG